MRITPHKAITTFHRRAETHGFVRTLLPNLPLERTRQALIRVAILGLLAGSLCGAAQSRQLDLVLLVENSAAVAAADSDGSLPSAVTELIRAADSGTRIAIVSYDDLAFPIIPLTRVTPASREDLAGALTALDFGAQTSNIAAGLERAIYEHDRNGRDGVTRQIVMIHSGEIQSGGFEQDQAFRRWVTDVLAPKAAQMSIQVRSIAFGGQADIDLAKSVANVTGGSDLVALSSADLVTNMRQVQADLFGTGETGAPTTAAGIQQVTRPDAEALIDPTKDMVISMPETARTPDVSETRTTAAVSGIDRLIASQPTSAGNANPSTAASTVKPATARPVVTNASAATAVGGVQQASPPTDGRQPMVLWIAIGVLSVSLAAALVGFLVVRQRNKRLTEHQAHSGSKPEVRLIDQAEVSGRSAYVITGKLVRVCRTPGRDSCNVVCITIPDDVISREHAFIEYRENAYYIADSASDNGTYLNDRRVQGARKLKDGDRVRFASFEFIFQCPAGAMNPDATPAKIRDTRIAANADAPTLPTLRGDTTTYSEGLTLVRGGKFPEPDAATEPAPAAAPMTGGEAAEHTVVR